MPIPQGTVKMVVSGTLPGGEIFSHGYQLNGNSGWSQTQLDAVLGVAVGGLTNNFLTTSVKAFFSTQTVWTKVRAYLIGAGGATILQSESATLNLAGTAAASPTPNQCALVATLLTGFPGRSKRGRSYLPGPSAGILAAGQISQANAQTIAAAFAAWMTFHRDHPTNPAAPVVASATLSATLPMVQVRVDTRLDVQRRRAGKQTITGVGLATV